MFSQVITRDEVAVDNVLVFNYNGDTRCMLVEKATTDYIQGKMLPWDDVLPTRRFASFRFDKMESPLHRVEVKAGFQNRNFDLANVR